MGAIDGDGFRAGGARDWGCAFWRWGCSKGTASTCRWAPISSTGTRSPAWRRRRSWRWSFPPFYFGQINEARCFPGALTIRPALLLELLQGVFDEIGRNGFRKIILSNAHGGNWHLLQFLAQSALWEEKPYALYIPMGLTPERQAQWRALLETELHGHACECETSISLANHANLVKMERVPSEPANPLKRMAGLPSTFTGIGWYSDYPTHYAGDARTATEEKGRALRQLEVDNLAEYIAAVKADQVVPALQQEFFRRAGEVTSDVRR